LDAVNVLTVIFVQQTPLTHHKLYVLKFINQFGCNNLAYSNPCYAEASGIPSWTEGECSD